MAIIDTGLGWYADENWLRQSAGKMGEVDSSTGGEFQLVPIVSPLDRQNVLDNGLWIAHSNPDDEWAPYIGASDVCYACYVLPEGSSNYKVVFVSNNSFEAAVMTRTSQHGTVLNATYDSVRNLYYAVDSQLTVVFTGYPFTLHRFYTLNDALDAFAGESITEFYKLNSNWAVSAIVKWYDWNNALQISPVLISTDANAVDISLDGQTTVPTALGTYEVDGKTFYMRAYLGGIDSGTVSATGAYYIDLSASHGATTLDALFYLLKNSSSLGVGHYSPVDPYSPDSPPSTIGGGEGTHIIPQNNITIPPMPTYGYSSTGFFSIWIPNDDQLKQLAAFMWNADVTTIDFWKRLISDPIDLIIGLSVLPFYISPQGVESVSLGGLDSGIKMSYTEEQFIDISCGSVNIPEVWGAYLDYNPYTKAEIFLPYIGTRELNVDEIMGRTISVTYRVDIVSGSCVALIEASKDDVTMLLYHFDGNCAVPVPITSFQMQGLVNKILATGGALGAAIASGGAAIPVAGAVSSALSLATTKRTAQRSGNIGSAAGLLDVQIPYLVFTRPNQAVPENQNTYTGYPSFITQSLSSLNGYTEVEVIHLHNVPCTEAELLEIDNLLKGGVIF